MGNAPKRLFRGKVNDIFGTDDPAALLAVASDRLAICGVVLDQTIPGKGKVCTHLQEYWAHKSPIAGMMPTQVLAGPRIYMSRMPKCVPGKSLLVKRLDLVSVELTVQGYLTGPGWFEYQKSGQMSNNILPPHLQEMDKLPKPIVSVYKKPAAGSYHSIDFEAMTEAIGDRSRAQKALAKSLDIYEVAAEYAEKKGILLVCASFEFGIDPESGELVLAGSTLSPDSSLYMRAEDYEVGKPPVSMTHQPIVEYIGSQTWNKREPAPPIPPEIISCTSELYCQISKRLTGISPVG